MSIDFPASPTNGQQFTAAGVTWTWDGAKWTAAGLSVAYLPLAGGTLTGNLQTAAGIDVGVGMTPPVDSYGGYLLIHDSMSLNGPANIGWNAYFNGTNWKALNAGAANLFGSGSGSFTFYADTGLTAGQTYTPTARASLTAAGLLTLNGGLTVGAGQTLFNGAVAIGGGIRGINYNTSNLPGGTHNSMGFDWDGSGVLLGVDGSNVGYAIRSNAATQVWQAQLDGGASRIIWYYGASSQFYTAGTFPSDPKLKTKIVDAAKDALAAIKSLRVCEFDLHLPFPDAQPFHLKWGLMADEEIERVIPSSFVPAHDEGGYDTLRELPIIAALVKAVQQLSEKVEALEGKLASAEI